MDTIQNNIKKLIFYSKIIYNKGLVSGTGGNISFRVNDIILITPTGYPLGRLKNNDISIVDINGKIIQGPKPSKELGLHLNIYRNISNINAIIHTHSFYSICVGILAKNEDDVMPPYTVSYVAKVGSVGLIPYYRPGSRELAEAVLNGIKSKKAVFLKNHGLIAIGKDLEDTLNIVEEIESNAKIHILLNGRGNPLSEKNIEELRRKK